MGEPPKFVVDLPLGGSLTLDQLLGPENPPAADTDGQAAAETSQQQFWPYVPLEYEPAPPHLKDAVREVNYITSILSRTLSPVPLPGDDLDFCSDLLLSLETRDDITSRVLAYTEADNAIRLLRETENIPQGDSHNIIARANALAEHWGRLKQEFYESTKDATIRDPASDTPFPPLVTNLPERKPVGWKLKLDKERAEEAKKLDDADTYSRLWACSYFRDHPPQPMGWAPITGDAWKTTDRAKISSGDLYHSPDWAPMYMGLSLQSIDVPFDWENPSAEEQEAHEAGAAFHADWISTMNLMRKERENYKKSQTTQ